MIEMVADLTSRQRAPQRASSDTVAGRVGREYREHFFLALDLNHEMHRNPSMVDGLLVEAARRRGEFRDAVAGCSRPRKASAARATVEQALRRGLTCGTVDGLSFLSAGQQPWEAPAPVADTANVKRLDAFLRRQRRACASSQKELEALTVEDLHVSVEFRLEQAADAIAQAPDVAAPGVPLQEFRNLQARAWRLGYELGIANVALVCGAYGRPTARRVPARRYHRSLR